MSQDKFYLTDWVFHYNPFDELWAAIPRDVYNEYWNDYTHPKVFKSKKIKTLLDLLHEGKGDLKTIKRIVGEDK